MEFDIEFEMETDKKFKNLRDVVQMLQSGSEVGLFVLDTIPAVRSPKVGTEKEEQEFFLHITTINSLWTLVLAPCFFFSPLGAFFL
jgi:hypothetical protein